MNATEARSRKGRPGDSGISSGLIAEAGVAARGKDPPRTGVRGAGRLRWSKKILQDRETPLCFSIGLTFRKLFKNDFRLLILNNEIKPFTKMETLRGANLRIGGIKRLVQS